MATANELRLKVRDKYRTIIGRNKYNQDRRNYCYKKFKDGKYYSDCSSSVSWTYREVGLGFGILNTVGMWTSKKLVDVPVVIKNGIIQNPEVLRIGDMLLFAGTNSSRKNYGYVGHVEMVGEISGKKITLYGHGSGTPKKHEMNAYCKYRYGKKTKKTKLGHTGLIRVRRYINDNGTIGPNGSAITTTTNAVFGSSTLSKGMKNNMVKEMQSKLIRLGYSCGSCGADGDFGDNTLKAVKAFQKASGLEQTGVFDSKTYVAMTVALAKYVEIIGKSVNVRTAPGVGNKTIGTVKKGTKLEYLKETSENGWHLVKYNNQKAWVSGIYSRLIE